MTVSVATLAQQALRLLGVRVVPLDDSPTLTDTVPAANIATAALVELGVLNSNIVLPTNDTVSQQEIATLALVEFGVLNSDIVPDSGIVSQQEIATAALVEFGVLNSDIVPSANVIDSGTLAVEALVQLGVIAADETPSSSDQALVVRIFQEVHDALLAKGIAKWGVTGIPDSFAQEYVKLTAAMAASSFGKTVDPAIVGMLEDRIHLGAIIMNNDIGFMETRLYAVHNSLLTRGIAKWGLNGIYRAYANEYIKLTVASASASFGKPSDPAMIEALEDRIRVRAIVQNNGIGFIEGYVQKVHDSLLFQGIAKWGVTGIPAGFSEEYVKLTVAYTAASFGKPVDPAVVKLLEDRVRMGALVLNNGVGFMLGHVASVHAALDAQGVVWWTGDAVPMAFVDEYVKLVAASAAPSFGKQYEPALIQAMEVRIRKGAMVLSADDNANQAVQAVHDDLVMRGIARWTVFDIPNAVGTSYVTLAADALGPLFQVRTDPNAARDAMTALYRYVALPTSGETVWTAYF